MDPECPHYFFREPGALAHVLNTMDSLHPPEHPKVW